MNKPLPHTTVTATITRAHFKRGKKEPHMCPVALALQSAGYKKADVRRFGRRWDAKWGRWITRLPVAARKVAVAFDSGKTPVLPVTFTINTRKDWLMYCG